MKKLSSEVQDVDRCVNEEQNSDSGGMLKTASSLSTDRIPKDISLTVAEIRARRTALDLQSPDWPCMQVHNAAEMEFQKHILIDVDTLLSIIDTPQHGDGLELRAQIFADALTIHRLGEHDDENGLIAIEKCPHPQCVRRLELSRYTQETKSALRGHNPNRGTSVRNHTESESVPDVQAADVDTAAHEWWLDQPHAIGRDEFVAAFKAGYAAALAASPVQPEVSKEQDNAKS